ncbi:MAG: hypothetical protein RIS47_1598 [Bacteroidota bacterium]|jgi:hypothetical protein
MNTNLRETKILSGISKKESNNGVMDLLKPNNRGANSKSLILKIYRQASP